MGYIGSDARVVVRGQGGERGGAILAPTYALQAGYV